MISIKDEGKVTNLLQNNSLDQKNLSLQKFLGSNSSSNPFLTISFTINYHIIKKEKKQNLCQIL